ncbi:MAG: acyl-CoA synthetase [Frankiales bacterium]|jgi:acyl-CoA synthetase (AMP-forming)/AMP-acid ligase II|nr:acyl-CoA synthetase [Frankiales bacterium]
MSAHYRAEGWWTDESLGALLCGRLADNANLEFVVHSQFRPARVTFGELLALARRVATGLTKRGIGAGDVVAFQLPNWIEAAATYYGAAMVGAVVAPIVHFYGSHEVRHILHESGARLFVVAESFGKLRPLDALESIRDDLPGLEDVVTVGRGAPAWATSWRDFVAGEEYAEPVRVAPDWPALVAYTSGTTATPKGVVHTHHTIGAEIRQLAATQSPDHRATLVGAPVGHGIGMLAALLIPLWRGIPVHLTDVWESGDVLTTIVRDNLTAGSGATYFLTSLLDAPQLTSEHLEHMKYVGLGGAAVPRAVADRATRLGISIARLYGSTEHPSITGCVHGDPIEKRLGTDGKPLPGVEIRLADDGEIWSRGPDCFVGYVNPSSTADVFDADGWYCTEDVGVLDEDGYLTITDRKKDIVIRGGENISAAEVEELVSQLPGVAEVAVVAAPDERLGEHACAFVRAVSGQSAPDLDAVRRHLADSGLARQKWPEDLRVVNDFPRTASGKIRKTDLRTQLRESG